MMQKNMNMPGFLREIDGGVTLAVKVQPRASITGIVDSTGDELRVRISAPPVDAAANEALVRFIAEVLGCPRGKVELVRGNTSRHKILKVYGVSAEAVLSALSRSK
jgi:uncharacterized protein